jgi:hypothetical protein
MKTKIIKDSGYWRLVALELKEFGKPIELAVITKDHFSNGSKWIIEDWRLMEDYMMTPFLSDLSSMCDLDYNKETLAFVKKNIKDYWFEERESGIKLIRWWRYDLTKIKKYSNEKEYSRRRSQWSFKEAKDYLFKTKKFWDSFKGSNYKKAKLKNKFRQMYYSNIQFRMD